MTITAVLSHENYQTVIHNKQHTVISDEPTHLGGNDTGMSPMALMASSLASCTLITMKMYAKRKGWNITQLEVSIQVEHDLKLATANFNKKITIVGTLTDDEKARLFKISSSCPIHKLLIKGSEITSTLL